jgi:hypothetical protein
LVFSAVARCRITGWMFVFAGIRHAVSHIHVAICVGVEYLFEVLFVVRLCVCLYFVLGCRRDVLRILVLSCRLQLRAEIILVAVSCWLVLVDS